MKNTLTLLFAKIFEKGIMFLFFMLLARKFGTATFGEFNYYFTIAVVLFVLFDLGGDFYQIREFIKSERLKIFNTVFWIKTFIFFIIIGLSLLFDHNIYLLFLLFSFYLDSIISIFRSSFYKNGYYVLESKFTIIEKTIFITIVLLNVFSIKSIIIMYVAFLISKLLYLFILSFKYYKLRYLLQSKKLFDLDFSKYYLFNSWSYVLHAMLVVVFVQIDIVMLNKMGISFDEIGLYAAAVKIYMIALILADVLFKQYYPKVAKYIKENDKTGLKQFILKIQNMNLYFSIYFAIGVMLFADELIYLAFGENFAASSKMLLLLSTIIIFKFSMYTYTAILSSSNLNYIKIYTSIACVVTNVGLNLVLIPMYGVYGAIIATIVTEILLVVLYKISSTRIVFVNFITWQEGIVVFLGAISFVLLYQYKLTLTTKLIIAAVLLISVVLNRKNIKQLLNF